MGDLLIGKRAIATSQGRGIYKGKGKGINGAGEGVLSAGYGNSNSKMDF